jgi:hypothetical protein
MRRNVQTYNQPAGLETKQAVWYPSERMMQRNMQGGRLLSSARTVKFSQNWLMCYKHG